MDVKFNVTEAKFNATIELTDITDEVYRDIVAYVSLRTTAEPEKKEKPTEEKPAATSTTGGKRDWRKYNKYPELADMFERYFKKVEESPNGYDTILMTTTDFMDHFPEFKEFGRMSVAKSLQFYCNKGEAVIRKNDKGHKNPCATFYVPVLKKPNPIGEAIKKGREESGLTVKELAELIEYPADVVKKWESGEYTPSCDGLSAMKLVLGEKLFGDLK